MTGTRKILQRETKQMTAEIANLKAFLDKKAAAEAAKQDPALAGKRTPSKPAGGLRCCCPCCVMSAIALIVVKRFAQ
jgi:hypothetical protein